MSHIFESFLFHQVATWKRNVLRTLVVMCQAGLALMLKDDIAYFGAFTGKNYFLEA